MPCRPAHKKRASVKKRAKLWINFGISKDYFNKVLSSRIIETRRILSDCKLGFHQRHQNDFCSAPEHFELRESDIADSPR